MEVDDRRKLGLGLTALGLLCTLLGVILLFDRRFISVGNVFFLVGLTVTIGFQATVKFFTRTSNRLGAGLYFGGTLIVLIGWSVVGVLVELYGFWLLFRGFIPTALQYLRKVPYLQQALDHPYVKAVINKIAPAQTMAV